MSLMFRRLRQISRVLPSIYSGNRYLQFRPDADFFALHWNPSPHPWQNIKSSYTDRGCFVKRFSTASETSHELLREDNLLSFIESTMNDVEGAYHCWMNNIEDIKDFCGKNGVFLVLFGAFLEEPLVPGDDSSVMFEKVKSLQQRYPALHVMGFQSSSSIFSDAVRTRFVQIAMKHYITFPVLFSNKNFTEMTDGACFGLFKGFKSPFTYYERDVNLVIIDKAIKELIHGENHEKMNNVKSPWAKQVEVFKEPRVCAFLRNLLLYFPGCISVDEMGNRLFLSDINHHRIIVFDGNGKILDCIGSSPGFEDGEFESAKLRCPAASFYHAADGCLYFVDSENHAVRKADMERRVLETLYPTSNATKKDNSLWSWIISNLWSKGDVDMKSDYMDSESVLFPWHLIKLSDNDLFIANQRFSGDLERAIVESFDELANMREAFVEMSLPHVSPQDEAMFIGGSNMGVTSNANGRGVLVLDIFNQLVLAPMCSECGLFCIHKNDFETLWIINLASGVIKEVIKGYPNIVEICGQLILEKSSLLKQIPGDWLQQLVGTSCPHEGTMYAGVMSSLATFEDYIAICDAVGQRVLKLNRESGCISSFHFSNFGILGLPYWVSSSLERVYAVGEVLAEGHFDHIQSFSLLPGRIDIQLNIDIPEDTELVEPLQEGCVWRQARGAAIEVSGAERKAASLEKVGVSQQWYDELDNLAFSEPEPELSAEDENTSDENSQERGVCINCAINTSPGTSEVIVCAMLYLKMKQDPGSSEDSKEIKASKIADILNPDRAEGMGKDQCVKFLMTFERSMEELVFMKPLRVKLKIDCLDHPKIDTKDFILTDSSIDVNVSLN